MSLQLQQTELIEINLNAPTSTTPEERQLNIIGNVCLVPGSKALPYAGDDDVDETALVPREQQLNDWAPPLTEEGKPKIRFYSVGPGSCRILCPLCNQTADAETVKMTGYLGKLSFVASFLSCCFPIFWLSFAYFLLQSHYKTKRLFCNKCGGHLGYYFRPT